MAKKGNPASILTQVRLTHREVEVLTLIAHGKNYNQISKALYIASETVRSHVEKICKKLGAENRTHAVAVALGKGIIRID